MRPENPSWVNKDDPCPPWPSPRIFQKYCNASPSPERGTESRAKLWTLDILIKRLQAGHGNIQHPTSNVQRSTPKAVEFSISGTLSESTWNACGENISKNNLSSACRRLEEAVRFRGVLLECPAFIVPKFNHDSTALKTTFSLRAPKMPLYSAARTLCENAFGRTGVANRQLSLYLSPVFSLASVSSSEISRVSRQQSCNQVQSSPFRRMSAQSGPNSRSLPRPLRSLDRTSIF